MSTIAEHSVAEPRHSRTPARSDQQRILSPVLGARCMLSWRQVWVVACAGMFYLHLNCVPLFHTDLWGHVNSGYWIIEHGGLMAEDPFMPLAEGMPSVSTAWLAQLTLALVHKLGGAEALSALFAGTVLATYLLIGALFFRQTARTSLALASVALVVVISSSRLYVIRPEMFGMCCLAVLLNLVHPLLDDIKTHQDRWSRRCKWLTAAVGLLFVLWANLHGSFAVGLLVLASIFSGKSCEAIWQTLVGKPRKWRECRRWLIVCEVALGCCLLNPYGMTLLVETALFARNPNLRDVQEWWPLQLSSGPGIAMLGSWLLLLAVFRHSRRVIRPQEVLLLTVFSGLAVSSLRMIGWYAVVFGFVITPHLADVWQRCAAALTREQPGRAALGANRSFKQSLIAVTLLWICFALSPSGSFVLDVAPRPGGAVLSPQTPTALTEFLTAQSPQGLVFAPQWWGDWLAWRGPNSLQPFVTTNIHLVPQRVWRDYMLIVQGQPGWERSLDRYGVRHLVIHKSLQPSLAVAARRSAEWRLSYEDELALYLQRVEVPLTEPSLAAAYSSPHLTPQ